MKNILYIILIILTAAIMVSSCASSQTQYNRAYAYYIRNDNDSALEILSVIEEKDPGFYPSHLLKAEIFIQKGDIDMAEKALVAARQFVPDNYMIPFNLGNIYFKKREYHKAIDQYSDSIKINTAYSKAYLNRGNTYMTIKSYKNALADYETFLQLTPDGYENVRKLAIILRQDLEAISP